MKANAVPAGHPRRTIHADLVRAMWPKVVACGIAGQVELEELDRRIRLLLASPDTVAVSTLSVLTWGRRPMDAH